MRDVTQLMRRLSAKCKAERAEDDQEDSQMMMVLTLSSTCRRGMAPEGGTGRPSLFDSEVAYTFFIHQCNFEGPLTKTK